MATGVAGRDELLEGPRCIDNNSHGENILPCLWKLTVSLPSTYPESRRIPKKVLGKVQTETDTQFLQAVTEVRARRNIRFDIDAGQTSTASAAADRRTGFPLHY